MDGDRHYNHFLNHHPPLNFLKALRALPCQLYLSLNIPLPPLPPIHPPSSLLPLPPETLSSTLKPWVLFFFRSLSMMISYLMMTWGNLSLICPSCVWNKSSTSRLWVDMTDTTWSWQGRWDWHMYKMSDGLTMDKRSSQQSTDVSNTGWSSPDRELVSYLYPIIQLIFSLWWNIAAGRNIKDSLNSLHFRGSASFHHHCFSWTVESTIQF